MRGVNSGRIFLLLFLFVPSVYSFNEADIEIKIKRGLENCYNFRWDTAEKEFESIIRNFPDDPRGYHYKSSIYLWYYLSSGNKPDLDLFLKYSDVTLEKSETLLDRNSENEKINYTIGNAYSYRTLGYAKSGSYINAIWASKKSEKYLKKVLEINPSDYDAYLGLGLYNFAAAQIPSAFKWALDIAGISGDEETGIKYIKISAAKGVLSRVEANYYLSQLLTGVLMDYKEAEKILKSLHRKYPSNILFSYSLAVVYLKLKNPNAAEKFLINIAGQHYPKFRQVISFSNFLLGDVNYRKLNTEEAIKYYKKFLETTSENNYTGIASLRLGLCYEISNNRSIAVEYYKKAGSGNSDIEDDLFAKRKGDILVKRILSEDEKTLISSSCKIEAGNFAEAYRELSEQIKVTKNQVKRAEIFYYLSEASFYMGNKEESLNYALKGAELITADEGWINAFCYYNAARASRQLGKHKDMIEYIEKAEDKNDWDYQSQIENMLKSLKR